MNRRHFLMGTASAMGAMRASMLASPNDTVRVALVGLRGQGEEHIRRYAAIRNVDIAAVCDIDESVLDQRRAEVEKLTGKRPARVIDCRQLMDDKSIDVISIATPNHQHTMQTVWACQAGKDVYVEKPCAHDMFEARQIVAAARKYDRVVQNGTHHRSAVATREAVKQLREGIVGDLYLSRGMCYKWRDTIGRKGPEPVPAGVHYDLWLGPAPLHEFTRNRFHYNWHWFWDYGNGDMGNQGAHEMDIARWGLGVTYPTKVTAIGGHFMFDDDQETPNTLTALFEFDDGGKKKMLEFAVRHWITNHEAEIGDRPKERTTIGNIFYGSKGYLVIEGHQNKYWTRLGPAQEPGPTMTEDGNNWVNFIDVVRSRKQSDLNAEVEEGAISAALVHLANISYRLGRSIRFDAASYTCPGDSEAAALFTRDYRAPFIVPREV